MYSTDQNKRSALLTTVVVSGFALSFWFFTGLTQRLFGQSKQVGRALHADLFLDLIRQSGGYVALSLFFLAVAIWGLWRLARDRSGTEAVSFLGTRTGATILILAVALCQSTLFFTPDRYDAVDAAGNVNSQSEAGALVHSGYFPYYTFRLVNGLTLGLQYPPMRSLLGGLANGINPGHEIFNIKLQSALFHLLLLVGIYRLLRVWRFERLACALVAVGMGGCHQTLVFYTSQGYATHGGVAFSIWTFAAYMKWMGSGRMRHALMMGYWLAVSTLCHPVQGIFTVYFLVPLFLYELFHSSWPRLKLFIQGATAVGCWGIMCLPYIYSLIEFSRYNFYNANEVTSFQDRAPLFSRSFLWLFKYVLTRSDDYGKTQGEYIGIVLSLLALTGLVILVRELILGHVTAPAQKRYAVIALILFGGGNLLYWGRDLALFSHVPFICLLKVYNRTFGFLAMGIALLAVRPIHDWIVAKRFTALAVFGVLLWIDLAPFWIRPAHFSIRPDELFEPSEFARYDRQTDIFYVLTDEKKNSPSIGTNEDVLFYRMGFSRFSPIDHEEQNVAAIESKQLRAGFAKLERSEDLKPLIERLRWFRVNHVVWKTAAIPNVELIPYGKVEAVTNGLMLTLDAPVMKRGLRQAELTVDRADLTPEGTVVLPVAYNPFVHVWLADDPKELAISERDGYVQIGKPLPVGTVIRFEAKTPSGLLAVSWIGLFFSVGMGVYFLWPRRERVNA